MNQDMAVSGRKTFDFQGTVSKGSAEEFDHSCDPCKIAGKHVEAEGYCVNCREYLCKNCFTYHHRLKATRHHQLLDKSNMPKHALPDKDSGVCTESCSVHGNETIKYFCTEHEQLGCTDCITLHHRECGLHYIPDKCAGIGDSDEYMEIMHKLNMKVMQVEDVIKKATARDKEIDSCHDTLIKDLIQFRKEINDHLDQLQKKVQADAGRKKSTDKQIIQSVLDTCTTVSADVKKWKTNLQDNKTSGQNGNLYIAMKRAKSNLKSDEVKQVKESLAKTDMQYKFERNQDLEKIVSKQDGLGHFKLFASLASSRRKKTFDKLTHKEDINVRTKTDETDCYITGCAVLSSGKIVLVDRANEKLKVVDTQTKNVMEEKTLDSGPWDVAVLPKDQIAVTMPWKKKILILRSNSGFSTLRTLPVSGSCRGIDYHQDQLYVVCYDHKCVHIMDTHGKVQNSISIDSAIFQSPNYILFSVDSKLIYISNYSSNSVVSITLQGDLSAVYKHDDLKGPVGMVMLDDGSLLVCGDNGITRLSSGDRTQGQAIIRLVNLYSICYNHLQREICIGSYGCNQLKVFTNK